ncbi:MAG: valine--tRNA ligase [Candidatus Doudnabacteria bacterium RIFCSPHIGHO2_01_FULL_50_11]|uniref:Valine--tRNA ligase n=1 Tax=Candidatus Doudnabacteria bacterium RIFCSPHIGHO2_01_FULL_50_11 TaxID=1817828 RepID=A0A1F5PHZ7_9BACT|nr:MAG: valine--tRNA ligase [Candidatus Doudnabacteria bacterium RIFCSPHIGHO2_01_FULL_50_11]HLC44905.1 valine--tRNA ligase [Patescibacteria group bacterium]
MADLPKSYDASRVENDIYQMWLKSGYFNPDNLPDAKKRKPFTISLPPPNVTGALHMGHAFEDTIQDTIIRFQRMRGKRALWVPGTDHAAIATQAKFEKEHYKKHAKSRHDYSRQEFFEMIQKFALANQSSILSQLHKLGLSLDWNRLAFTLDKERELAVRTAFKRMYDAGLIYRGYRVVNWDVKGQTTISDDEIDYEEIKGVLYTFKYSKDFPIAISTTRPETKVGDAAVAVHPEDERYKKFVGQEFNLEFVGVPLRIKIIADKEIDPAYGTGAVGVTPLHSMIDFEIAQRHNLAGKQVINEFGKMKGAGELLEGKKTAEARVIIVNWLKQQRLLEKEETITQNLSRAQRTGGIVEPLPKLQWFVDVNKKFVLSKSKLSGIPSGSETTLKDIMRKTVENGQIEIMPERFAKTYFHWLDNLRDWCISRQIIYGHRIPIWYCRACQAISSQGQNPGGPTMHAAIKDLAKCPTCNSTDLEKDTDTLDTWFSSGLWTFSTLGWPKETADLKTYHPTSVMMPGYEILFFWVARMILMSGFLLGDIPFHQVYLHGIVRDKQGRKFSKSLSNGIDPLEMTAKYGTDALRVALVFGAAPGNDVIFDEQKVKGMKHFANKLWNIARFILTNVQSKDHKFEATTEADQIILKGLERTVTRATENLENYRLHEAAQEIYQFTWHEFADKYLEVSKYQMGLSTMESVSPAGTRKNFENQKGNTQQILLHCLITQLKLLHPFMPFITEHIWQLLRERKLVKTRLLMITQWPS